ncbi:MAG: 50S ribosomal protein L9 [Candidatus Bostrichicola ureolyticus]|nr:MAG: 50S ribosomal protein L9 [Candidatus Bostrichicola ureolyticus]
MKIILKKDIKTLGIKYDILNVKSGYARNYLFPKGYAILATKTSIKDVNEIIKQKNKKNKFIYNKYNDLIKKLSSLNIKLYLNTDTKGKLFGSINEQLIINYLKEKNISIKKENIKFLEKKIKYIGIYKATLELDSNIKKTIEFEILSNSTKN